MGIDQNGLLVVLIYLCLFAAALFAVSTVGVDEFLLEEATHATYLTAPFSILATLGLTLVGIEVFESNGWAYVIWLVSAALNSVALYMLVKRTGAMLSSKPQANRSSV